MTDSFLVCTAEGKELLVKVIRSRINTSTLDGPSSIEGLAQLRLQDGKHI